MFIVLDICINICVFVFVNFSLSEFLFFFFEIWNELLLVLFNNNDFFGK